MRCQAMLPFVLAFWAVVSLTGCWGSRNPGSGAGTSAAEEEPLRGTWLVTEIEPPLQDREDIRGSRMIFTGDVLTFVSKGGSVHEESIKLDPARTPRHITQIREMVQTTVRAGSEKTDNDVAGIYEINGDTLRICMSQHGPRPTEFKATTDNVLITLKRESRSTSIDEVRKKLEPDYSALLVGKWEVTQGGDGVKDGSVIEFTGDGKVTVTIKGNTREGRYTLKGRKVETRLPKAGEHDPWEPVNVIENLTQHDLVLLQGDESPNGNTLLRFKRVK
jgi:uncharacterized protein (TIGR03066 family)